MGRSSNSPQSSDAGVAGRFNTLLGQRSIAGPSEAEQEQAGLRQLQQEMTNDQEAKRILGSLGTGYNRNECQAILEALIGRIDTGRGLGSLDRQLVARWLDEVLEVDINQNINDLPQARVFSHMENETRKEIRSSLEAIPDLIPDTSYTAGHMLDLDAERLAKTALGNRWNSSRCWISLAGRVKETLRNAFLSEGRLWQQTGDDCLDQIDHEIILATVYDKDVDGFHPTPELLRKVLERVLPEGVVRQ